MIRLVVLCLAAAAAPVAAQAEPGSIAVGVRGGVEVHRGGWGQQHVGLQVWIPLTDRFNVVPALDLLHEFPDDPLGAWSGRAWRGYLTLQGRPFGPGWLPAVGYGLAAYYGQADNAGRSLNVSTLDLTDTVVFAFDGPRWRVRPYADVYVVNVLVRRGQPGVHVFFGVKIAVR